MVEKLLVLDYHHHQTINLLKYSAKLDTSSLNLVTRYASLSSYDLISYSGSKSHLAYVDITLT